MAQSRLLILFLLCVTQLVWGCGSSPAEERPVADRPAPVSQSPVMAEPVFGGRIVMGTIADASNLIPPLSSDSASHEVADLLYVGLLKYDKNLQIVPYAAESYQVLEGGRLLRFQIRKGIRWQDGEELTAEDVEFTYRLMIDPKTPTAYAEDYKAVKEFRRTGRYSFEVRYDRPFARSLVTWMGAVLPKHVLEGEDLLSTRYSREPVSAGPFTLKEWIEGRQIVLERNERYFLGRPNLDQVVYRVIPDTATMFLELKAGNLDMMGLTPQQYLFQTKGGEWDRDFRKFRYLSFGYTYMGYNLRHPLFKERRVRQALAMAVDKEEIVKGVLLGQGLPAIGPYNPNTWVYNRAIADYPFDPAQARALLAEAGWRDTDGDGWLDKDGRPFSFTILTNQGNDQRLKTAVIIQNRLKQVGVEVRIRAVEWATFLREFVDKGRFEAVILGWSITQDPDVYDVWHSSKAEPGGLNFVGYADPEADALLEQGRRTLDQEQRKRYYDRFQEILHRDQPYMFLYVPYALPMVQSRFQGIEPAPAGITYNFERWWVPSDRQRFRLTP